MKLFACNNFLKQKKYLLVLMVLIFGTLVLNYRQVYAEVETFTTSVTVGNTAPAISAVVENPASDATSPTNVGASMQFVGTASDDNGENYYLIICRTNVVNASNGGAPTCDGAGNLLCVSNSTATGVQTSCSYTVVAGDSESLDWYAFACDGNSSSAQCSSSSQGTGSASANSPVKVNHIPTFTGISSNSPRDPGQTVTWTATADDPDTDTTPDTVTLLVCKTAGLSGTACDGGAGDTWCTGTPAASNPTCTYDAIPDPAADATHDAYVYVFDNHGFMASGGSQGTNSSYTINNTDPVVTSVTLNGGLMITLTENTTTNVIVTGTVSDHNGCQDFTPGQTPGGTVFSSVYSSGVGFASCDDSLEDDNNDCYAEESCTITANTCDGASDDSTGFTCTIPLQFHADSTVTGTQYAAENWLSTISATDDDSAVGTGNATGVEIDALDTIEVTNAISYGNLTVGGKNDPLDKITVVTNTGNIGMDIQLSGTDMDDGATHTIAVAQQKYALSTDTAYGSGIALSTSATEAELNLQKTVVTGSPKEASIWWGIEIPTSTIPGDYSGTNTIESIIGEIINW